MNGGQRGDGRPCIGVTMRVVEDPAHGERRDALAHDWARFIAAVLPEALWMPLPNTGVAAVATAKAWALDGLILTGGDDIGSFVVRDQTERALLDHFVRARLPVFGVCRGLQMIQTYFGGELAQCPRAEHTGQRHTVRFVQDVMEGRFTGGPLEVNSYHAQGIRGGDLAAPLTSLAQTGDWVEAATCAEAPVAGVMWHPEREDHVRDIDRALIRNLFVPDLRLAVGM